MTNPKIDVDGTEIWYDELGMRHRDNGLPAVIYTDGTEQYFIHGLLYHCTKILNTGSYFFRESK